VSKSFDTIILGAGAAGLMCALTAGQRGRRVLVLERSNKVGKKILMSGGGKCNFTNLHVTPDRFLSANPHFCKSALARYSQWDFIEMVERHGIEYFEKETVNGLSGQLFCRDSSKQIVAMLRKECEQVGVEIREQCETQSVSHTDGFRLLTNQGKFSCETLVVATGALSIPSLGGSGFAFELGRQFGLRQLPTSAGLVPFTFSGDLQQRFSLLSGLSCEVVISNSRTEFREDLLFTHRGLSGPAVLQISSYWQPGEPVVVNLLPDEEAVSLFLNWKRLRGKSVLRTHLAEYLPRKLVLELESMLWPGLAEKHLADWPDLHLEEVAGQIQSWSLTPSGTEGYRTAEVTLGGIDTRDLSSRTMECGTPGLFFVGEALDVTGHLGGFNFQWAWASGFAAGQSV
jgi:predicted Rossmann fold flavoprotein